MWVILFTAKLLIINFTNSSIGQAFTEGCLKKKKKKIALTKGHFGHHGAKGQVLKHPPPPPLHVPGFVRERVALCNFSASLPPRGDTWKLS